VLFDLARSINRAREEGSDVTRARNTLVELAGVLGFTLELPARLPVEAESLLRILVSVRSQLRQTKQWQLADKVRDQLAEAGIALEDTPEGTEWKTSRESRPGSGGA